MNNERIFKLKQLCASLVSEPHKDVPEKLNEIRNIIGILPKETVAAHTKPLLGAFYFYLRPPEAVGKGPDLTEGLLSNLTVLFEKSTTDNVNVYKNVCGYLLNEIYVPLKDGKVKGGSEERKLLMISCIKSLHDSITANVVRAAYNKEFVIVLSNFVYMCIGLAQHEKLRSLRISSIECVMSVAKVLNFQSDDLDTLRVTANVFMHFFPGICRALTSVALEDQKTGHKIICTSVKCFGRITRLLMQDYDGLRGNEKPKVSDFQKPAENGSAIPERKWKNADGLKRFLEGKRDGAWFRETDSHLFDAFKKLCKLCYHPHEKVRLELGLICGEIAKSCHYAIPKTSIKLFEVLITLSEDVDEDVSKSAHNGLSCLDDLKRDDPEFYKKLFDDFEENFLNTVIDVPSIFQGVDDNRKLSQMNLLCGYLKVFKKHSIASLLYNAVHLRHFMVALVTICTVDKLNLRLFDEYTIQDFDVKDLPERTPWKTFKYHSDASVSNKLQELFRLLAEPEIVENIFHYQIDVFEQETDYKKEATLLLSDIVSKCAAEGTKEELSKTLILTYLDVQNLSIPVHASKTVTLSDTHENIVQICLQLEGVGKLAMNIGESTNKLLLKILYPIIEKAGSVNPLIRLAGLRCLSNISKACGLPSVTELINKNYDYLTFHVARKLKYYERNKSVLDVYGVVMKHCSVDTIGFVADIVENISEQFSATVDSEEQIPFLRIYDISVKCMVRWFDVKVVLAPVKSKQEKLDELYKEKEELFESNKDLSDEAAKEPVEEMWKEDNAGRGNDENEEGTGEGEEWKEPASAKPKLPIQIRLTVLILKTSVNYLCYRNDDVKILALDILNNGVEIIRDYEDELLPVTHKIWTALQYLFKDSSRPLIINLSFQLLVTLARVSKDFIRSRTSEKALPYILKELNELSSKSYLKDRGSDYRTTKSYKLQTVLLRDLDRLITDIAISSEDLQNVFSVTKLYLSKRQPLPLQNLCVAFYKTMLFYDPKITTEHLNTLSNEEYMRNVDNIRGNM